MEFLQQQMADLTRRVDGIIADSVARFTNASNQVAAQNAQFGTALLGGNEKVRALAEQVSSMRLNIKALQEALDICGCSPGRHDGKMGPNTRSAIREFQKKAGIGVDGSASNDASHMLTNAA